MIAIFGAPGAGKTVQGQLLSQKYGWEWVSSRDLLLSLSDKDVTMALNHGMPIDNEKSVEVFGQEMKRLERYGLFQKAVLDGFPMNVSQIYYMAENDLLKYLDGVIVLRVPRGELWKRLVERKRVDDTRAAVERRQDLYERATFGMLHVLKANGVKIADVNGQNSPEDVLSRIEEKLGEWEYGDKISGFDQYIYTSQKLSETEILVMGNEGETRILKKNTETDEWKYGDKLSETEILVMGGNNRGGRTRILKKNTETNKWEYGEGISHFNNQIYTSRKLSDTEILVMGVGVETRILNVEREKSLEALKKKLDQIISKKD